MVEVVERRLSLAACISAIAAMSFLAGAVGYVIGTRDGTGPNAVDIGFYKDMTTHHNQAVDMAQVVIENGENPTIRIFAQEIATFQSYELGLMDAALRSWNETSAQPEMAMAWMSMPVPYEYMPGLARPDQMAELRQATGSDADELFLELMAEHHRGGVHMADFAAKHAAVPEVRELAARMAYNQRVEIDEYRSTADRLGLDVDIEPYGPAPDAPGG